jgi:L-rhamnose mutarotase
MEENPRMQEWWTHTKPCFVGHDKQEYYLDWKEIFYLA